MQLKDAHIIHKLCIVILLIFKYARLVSPVRNLLDARKRLEILLSINNIISRRRFLNINNIISNCFVCFFAVAGVKEFEIRLPPGLLSVNGLPTYFQLTSNQQTLFRGTNNRIKRFGTRHGREQRWA